MPETPAEPTPTEIKTPARVSWWMWPQILALDAPLVALVWQEVMARAHNVRLSWEFRLALFLSTWIIYLLDRTLDGIRGEPQQTARHAFCIQHRKLILGLLLPALGWLLLWTVLFHLPAGALWQGMALGTLALTYLAIFAAPGRTMAQALMLSIAAVAAMGFISQLPVVAEVKLTSSVLLTALLGSAVLRRVSHTADTLVPKQFLGALIFSQACVLASHFWDLGAHLLICREALLLFGLLALNLVSISAFEKNAAGTDGQSEPSTRMVEFRLPLALGLLGYLLAGLSDGPLPALDTLVITCVAALLFVYQLCKSRASAETHHLCADLCLILPPTVWFLIR